MQTKIIRLQGLILPDSSNIKRRHVRKKNRRTPHYMERYDRHTLVYDCFYDEARQQYVMTMPLLLNFWPLIKQHLFIDGQKYTGKIKRERRQCYEQLYIPYKEGSHLQINSPDYKADIPVRKSLVSLFAGQNVIYAANKNNKLEWIRQWVQFHRNAHNLESVLLVDNNSTDYQPEAIIEALKDIDGLKTVVVVKADFPYGPSDGNGKAIWSPRFFQTAMFNLFKKDACKKARAVLNVDIDELVVSNNGSSVFDAAAESWLGAVSFREQKIYPISDVENAYAQREHGRIVADQQPGNTKWCAAPSGFINRFRWAVHRYGGLFFPLTETEDYTYLHCFSTSTSWKKNRYKQPANLIDAPEFRTVLSKYLP